jgi:hypothetical protein
MVFFGQAFTLRVRSQEAACFFQRGVWRGICRKGRTW